MTDAITGTVVFVNQFTVHGPTVEFERTFADTAAFLRRRPGLLEYTLLRHTERPGSYLNIARWQDEESFRRAVGQPEFRPHAEALRALCVSEPNLYAPCQTFLAEESADHGRPRR
ncbi:antibiotic biosynthesis monooxygenase family protein [Streptomyces sp. NPDC055036]